MLKHNMDKTTEANNKREQILHDDVQALEMAAKKNKKRDHRMQKDVRALGMAADAELNVLKKKDNMQLNIIKELEERESKSSLVFNQNFKRVDSQIKNTVGAIQNIGSTVGRLEKRQNDVLKKLNLIKQNIATLRNTDMTTDKDIKETTIAINELSKEVGDISTRGLNAEIHIKNISEQLAHLEAKFNVNVENNDVPDLRTRLVNAEGNISLIKRVIIRLDQLENSTKGTKTDIQMLQNNLTTNGTLNVTGGDAKVCIDGVCITKADLSDFKVATASIAQLEQNLSESNANALAQAQAKERADVEAQSAQERAAQALANERAAKAREAQALADARAADARAADARAADARAAKKQADARAADARAADARAADARAADARAAKKQADARAADARAAKKQADARAADARAADAREAKKQADAREADAHARAKALGNAETRKENEHVDRRCGEVCNYSTGQPKMSWTGKMFRGNRCLCSMVTYNTPKDPDFCQKNPIVCQKNVGKVFPYEGTWYNSKNINDTIIFTKTSSGIKVTRNYTKDLGFLQPFSNGYSMSKISPKFVWNFTSPSTAIWGNTKFTRANVQADSRAAKAQADAHARAKALANAETREEKEQNARAAFVDRRCGDVCNYSTGQSKMSWTGKMFRDNRCLCSMVTYNTPKDPDFCQKNPIVCQKNVGKVFPYEGTWYSSKNINYTIIFTKTLSGIKVTKNYTTDFGFLQPFSNGYIMSKISPKFVWNFTSPSTATWGNNKFIKK
jgi:hypothetical protein